MVKARVIVDRRKFSIVFEPNAADGTEIRDRLQKWSSLKSDILAAVVKNKCALICSCVSKEADFRLSEVLKSPGVEIHSQEGRDGFIYSSAACGSFSVEDLTELASTMEFELAQLWIQVAAAGFSDVRSASMNEEDTEKLFEVVQKVVLGETDHVHGIECIGNVDDGYKILWLNPPNADMEQMTENLRKWCPGLAFELHFAD